MALPSLQNVMQPFLDVLQRAFPPTTNGMSGSSIGWIPPAGQPVRPGSNGPEVFPESGGLGFLSTILKPIGSIFSMMFGLGAAFKKGIKQVNPAAELDEEDFASYANPADGSILHRLIRRISATNEQAAHDLNAQFRSDPSALKAAAWTRGLEELFNLGLYKEVDGILKSREQNAYSITYARFAQANNRYLAIQTQIRAMEFEQASPEYQQANARVRMQMTQEILQAESAAKVDGANVQAIDQALDQRLAALWNNHVNDNQAIVQEHLVQRQLQQNQKSLAEQLQQAQRNYEFFARQPAHAPLAAANLAGLQNGLLALQQNHAAAQLQLHQHLQPVAGAAAAPVALGQQLARQRIQPV
jgi:hypothetical protein